MKSPKRRLFAWTCAGLVFSACGGGKPALAPSTAPPPAHGAVPDPRAPIDRAEQNLAASEYAAAERDFMAEANGKHAERARLGLAETMLVTGRYGVAIATARSVVPSTPAAKERALVLEARALRAEGRLDAAETALLPLEKQAGARDAWLLLGEIRIERGRREAASGPLLQLIEEYNEERIAPEDGHSLALVGRAAHLMRSARDANDAFGEAEATGANEAQLLLFRAELFLEKYDPGHAEEVLSEVLERAPHHPEALVLMAHTRLDQALDFVEAERLARAALAVNPRIAGAFFVLAGIALRDMDLDLAEKHIADGLKARPGDLDLLSLRAAIHFVGSKTAAFEADRKAVLAANPEWSRFYAVVGEFADWEHRYDGIVELMHEAVKLDPDDPVALASLGLNLIRAGRDAEGVAALSRAFTVDPYNARVFNTLELFEKVIPKDYVSVKGTRFNIRYAKDDKALLERYVPPLLEKAWTKLVEHYGFTPKTPVGIEIYADRQHFAVRTSGLPETAIQGVCFGHTLATMSPQKESFNLGMTLWHELAHVFHIQLSEAHVPRWFTEGLAEYETLLARPEWAREQDPELYEMRRAGRLPSIDAMNKAFTRAEQLSDMATAYYASSRLVIMLGERHGMPKLSHMLRLWSEGKRTSEVFQGALGVTPAEEDRRFAALLDNVLARYPKQFVPNTRAPVLNVAFDQVEREPKNAQKHTVLALALMRAGKPDDAQKALNAALALDAKFADARYLSARLALAREKPAVAAALLRGMLADGSDGYDVQMLLAEAAAGTGDPVTRITALQAAARLDPTQSSPLYALLRHAEEQSDADGALALLRKLVLLSEHDASVFRELLVRLVARNELAEAVRVGESAVNVDITGFETHFAYAEALEKTGDKRRASFEYESALLCEADPVRMVEAKSRLKALGVRVRDPEKKP